MTTGEFAEMVQKMRKAQKNYFRTKSKDWLEQSKIWERQVDITLELRNKREMERQNPSLF